MDSVMSFFSPRKPQGEGSSSEAQTQPSTKALFKKDEMLAQSTPAKAASPFAHVERGQLRSLFSPSAVAAAKHPIKDPEDHSHSNDESEDFDMADPAAAPAPPAAVAAVAAAEVSILSPQVRRSGRASEGPSTLNPDVTIADDDDEQHAFKRLVEHRRTGTKGNSFELKVEWEDGPDTWEPEENLHRDAPESLFAYWESQDGRPLNPNDPELFEIFAIRKHTKNKKRLQVEWLGYDKSEWSWLPKEAVEETAKSVVDAYWKGLKKKSTK